MIGLVIIRPPDPDIAVSRGAPRILSIGSTEVTVNGRTVAILFPFWHKLGTPFCGAEFHEHTGRSAHWPDGRMPP
jgi:hypothetical protein